jgi:hypothetical protein
VDGVGYIGRVPFAMEEPATVGGQLAAERADVAAQGGEDLVDVGAVSVQRVVHRAEPSSFSPIFQFGYGLGFFVSDVLRIERATAPKPYSAIT